MTESELLNLGIELSIKATSRWLESVADKLIEVKPELSHREAVEIDKKSRAFRDAAFLIIEDWHGKGHSKEQVIAQLRLRLPEVSGENLELLYATELHYGAR